MKVLVIHHSSYGNGKKVAEAVAEGLGETGHSAVVVSVKELDAGTLGDFDAFVIGSPTHAGGPTFKIGGVIKKIGKACKGKPYTCFATHISPNATTVDKLVSKAQSRGLRKILDGKMFKVKDIKGPLEDGVLEEARDFGTAIGKKLK
jgi:menaquinone-dependent protoporphyrinogen IX oxidase